MRSARGSTCLRSKKLYLSEETVKNHISGLLSKLSVERRVPAAAIAARFTSGRAGVTDCLLPVWRAAAPHPVAAAPATPPRAARRAALQAQSAAQLLGSFGDVAQSTAAAVVLHSHVVVGHRQRQVRVARHE
ncbi:LuxR C-terminal-related transcriptional regulator [Streptomyces sp. NPDC059460]|uniref:LuxR C-terminal-related transcriptional regulator n=1 Tax=Streptomyces sp. NPDC059460 TaxID=3346840 RepID=UPI0036DC839E